jgi:catechol 2,3-dioxygenase-like lactoylglutathione lyase family enzyme
MAKPLALNHVGVTVPDMDRAIEWYGAVLGFRLIYRRVLEHRPDAVPKSGDFRAALRPAHQAHMPAPTASASSFSSSSTRQWPHRPAISATTRDRHLPHHCVTDPDLDGLVSRVVAHGGRQRTRIWQFLEGRPYRLVNCEDPFGNIVEAFSHPMPRPSPTCPAGMPSATLRHDQAVPEPAFHVPGTAFLDRFAAAAGDGFAGVEMTFPYDTSADEIRAAAGPRRCGDRRVQRTSRPDRAGIRRGLAAVPGHRREYLDQIREGIAYAQSFGCRLLLSLAGVVLPDASRG